LPQEEESLRSLTFHPYFLNILQLKNQEEKQTTINPITSKWDKLLDKFSRSFLIIISQIVEY
jgi:hypothetical protein